MGGITINGSEKVYGYHYTDWLNEDPHYPCNAVEDEYKDLCYFLQTDRMLYLLGNIELIGDACTEAEEQFRFSCFISMGRTVSGFFLKDSVEIFRVCTAVKDIAGREACLSGALFDQLWDETQADGGIEFCRISENSSFEQKCYRQLIARSSEVIPEASRKQFCKKMPYDYYYQCIDQEAPPAHALYGQERAFSRN